MDKEAEPQYHFRISTKKAVDRNVRDYSITALSSMFCLNCDCVLLMSLYRGRFCLRSAGFSSLYREYRYMEDRYIGFCPIHFTVTNNLFPGHTMNIHRYTGNIVIYRIVISGLTVFCKLSFGIFQVLLIYFRVFRWLNEFHVFDQMP